MWRCAVAGILLALWVAPAMALETPALDLTALSIEELMNVEVFSAYRWEQTLFESAAAVEVITGEDIRRAGVLRLPEALRLLPGVHAWHIDASKWGITVRGFNNRFANKLLVLIDGRTVYSPLFAGVWWEVQDLLLDDVERIEVIRGPGGSLWGTNAVNGVIDIITRRTDETQGSRAWAAYGPEERGWAAFQHGGRLGRHTSYRVYGKAFRRDALATESGGRAADGWHMLRGGFRADGERGASNWTLSGEAYDGRLSQTMEEGVSLTPPYLSMFDFDTEVAGGHVLGRLVHRSSSTSEVQVAGYYDGSTRDDTLAGSTLHTLDLDLQHRFGLGQRHTAIWGGEFRSTWDRERQTERVSFDPAARRTQIASGFLQDEVRLLDARLRLVLGAKFERNDYTGVEVLPNLRGIWVHPGDRYALWGAVSRSVRLPTRAETDGRHLNEVEPLDDMPGAPLAVVRFQGNPDMKAEELLAYELGFRVRPGAGLDLDLATFYHRYDRHLSGEPAAVVLDTTAVPHRITAYFTAGNKIAGHTLGAELDAEWRAHRRWRLRGGYAFLLMDLAKNLDSQDPGTLEFVGDNPRHRAVLRSLLDLGRRFELDAALFYTGRLPHGRQDRHLSLDLHLDWQPCPAIGLALVVQNLLGAGQIGLDPELFDTLATYSQRSIFASLAWRFRVK